jgi:hypothetical protein
VLVDVVADGHDELFEVFEDAAAQLILGQVAEEAFDHIEPTGRRWGEVDMEALVAVQPADDLLVFMGGIVVADQVDLFFLGDGLVDQAEKLQPLLVPMPLLAEAEDLAVKGVQSRKQRCCAVAFIVMRHRLAASFLQWQPGLGSVQGLYLALLIDAQNQRMLRRVQIQADDCFQLTGKIRITTYLEGLDQVRFESMRVPDASHAGLADTNFPRHSARGPMGRVGWSSLRGLLDHGVDHRCRNRRRAPGSGSIFQQPLYASQQKSPSPQRYHPRADLQFFADLLVLFTVSGQQHDTATQRYPHGHRAPSRLPLQLMPNLRIQNDRPGYAHDWVLINKMTHMT